MATNINYYINNTPARKPVNWRELSIELNFDKDKDTVSSEVTLTDFDLVKENDDAILNHISKGTSNGVGVFEGIPLRIELERGNALEKPFDGYLDLTQSGPFSNIHSIVKAVELQKIDWVNDVADSVTFDYLYRTTGSITDDDFIKVPYIINSIPNYVDAAVGVLSVYVMVKEIKDAIQKIVEFVAELPLYYVFSTYIRLILYIVYLILLIIALIKLVKNVILLIIQPVKYHSAMSFKKHLEKGCEHLGLRFMSNIFDVEPFSNAYLIPAKYYNPVNSKEKQILGFTDPELPKQGYYKGTFGEFLRICQTMFKAKIQMRDGELWLVRQDYSISNARYTMPPVEQREFRLNTDEFKANYLISFETDLSEKNTIQEYLGTSYQVILSPSRVVNTNMVLMKGFEEVRIPFALAKTKTDLTVPEQILDSFLKVFGVIVGALVKVVNAVITVLNIIISAVNDILKKLATIGIKIKFELPLIPLVKFPDFNNIFQNRKGMMKIESDIINVSKCVIMKLGSESKFNKIDPENGNYLSAKYLYDNYHYINSFMPSISKPNGNQYYLKEFEKVPFTFDDYELVKNDNRIFMANGDEAEVDSLKWNIWEQYASMRVRINKLYTNNFTQITLEPDGQ